MPISAIIWNKVTSEFDATEDQTITGLVEFESRLYAITAPIHSSGGCAKCYVSDDGLTWTISKVFPTVDEWAYAIAVHDDGGGSDALYVAYHTDAKIWRFDGGASWVEIATTGLNGATTSCGGILWDPCQMISYSGKLYLTMNTSSPVNPVWSSTDGMTWVAELTTDVNKLVIGSALAEFGGDLYLGGTFAWNDTCWAYKKSAGVWDTGTELIPPSGSNIEIKEFVEFNGDLWAVCDSLNRTDIQIYQLNSGAWTYRAYIPHNNGDLESAMGIGFVASGTFWGDGCFRVGSVDSANIWCFQVSPDGSTWSSHEAYQDGTDPDNDVAHPHTYTTFGVYDFFAGGYDWNTGTGLSAAIWTDAPPYTGCKIKTLIMTQKALTPLPVSRIVATRSGSNVSAVICPSVYNALLIQNSAGAKSATLQTDRLVPATYGFLQYSVDSGTTWNDIAEGTHTFSYSLAGAHNLHIRYNWNALTGAAKYVSIGASDDVFIGPDA